MGKMLVSVTGSQIKVFIYFFYGANRSVSGQCIPCGNYNKRFIYVSLTAVCDISAECHQASDLWAAC